MKGVKVAKPIKIPFVFKKEVEFITVIQVIKMIKNDLMANLKSFTLILTNTSNPTIVIKDINMFDPPFLSY